MAAISSSIASAAYGAYKSSKAGSQSRRQMRRGRDEANAIQQKQYEQTRTDMEQYRESGANALNNINTNNFEASPGYEFRRSEGMRDIGNTFAAKGSGGNALKALAEWNQNVASNEYGNWFNRQFSLAEQGRGAAGMTTQAGINSANQQAGNWAGTAANLAQSSGDQAANMVNSLNSGISNVLYASKRPQIKGQSYYLGDQPGRG